MERQVTKRKYTRADATQRAQRAWDLRTQGNTWDDIAQQVGYSNGANAAKAVRRWRDALPGIDLDEQRDMALGRALWLLREAAQDVQERRPGAVTAMVRVEQRLASLLGLDSPQRLDIRTGALDDFAALFEQQPQAHAREVVDAEVVA